MRFILLSLVLVAACDDSKPAAPSTPAAPAAPAKAAPVAVAPAAVAPATVAPAAVAPAPIAAPAAATAAKPRRGELDAAAGKPIIDAMNDICGDTYCEGEYEWTFKSVSCASGKCTLAFTAKHQGTKKVFDESVEFRSSDYTTDESGSATEFFQQSIDQAITAWESKGKK